jgi:NAD(P)-dependent dehydrogenase (short-subunit alcohol dehydrogenase family)
LTKELPAELQYQIETTSPLGRFCCDRGDPSRSHLLLASDEASSIAGQVLAVDGGLVMV